MLLIPNNFDLNSGDLSKPSKEPKEREKEPKWQKSRNHIIYGLAVDCREWMTAEAIQLQATINTISI
jgi:hypothetical protein